MQNTSSKDQVISAPMGNVIIKGEGKEIVTDLSRLNFPLRKCYFTEKEIAENQRVAADLITTIQANHPNCFSLSANQIGENKMLFAFHRGFQIKTSQEDFVVILNPVMLPNKSLGMRRYRESCLSYPETLRGRDQMHSIRRYKKIKLNFQNIFGVPDQHIFTGELAAVIQHEMDHMVGIIR